MDIYQYKAFNTADGKIRRGRIEADSVRQARANLREQGLYVLEVLETKQTSTSSFRLGGTRLSTLTRQFSALLDAGLNIDEALAVLVEQVETERERRLMRALRQDIASGLALSASMSRQPKTFPPFYRALVRSGEESGKLPMVLHRLADYLEKKSELASRMGLAFIYPTVVLTVSILVIFGMLTWVVPQMVQVFQGAKQTLPILTRILLAISHFSSAWGGWILLALVGLIIFFVFSLRKPAFRMRFDAWRLAWPWIGKLERSAETARFASTLAILSGSGVPLLSAIGAASSVMRNRVLKSAAETVAKEVREGVSLARALMRTGVFPPILTHLVSSGEATGRLDVMLERAADEQSRELNRRVEMLTQLLGPAVVLLMGGVVLFIVLAILLPVFEMNQLVK